MQEGELCLRKVKIKRSRSLTVEGSVCATKDPEVSECWVATAPSGGKDWELVSFGSALLLNEVQPHPPKPCDQPQGQVDVFGQGHEGFKWVCA